MAPAYTILNGRGIGPSRLLAAGPSSQMRKSMGDPYDEEREMKDSLLVAVFILHFSGVGFWVIFAA